MRTEITTEADLRAVLGTPMQRALDKERQAFTTEHREWLAASPFCLVATSDAAGRCDVSPKGDPAGFALVIDETTLALPERPGNRRADGFANILENPRVGLIFFVPGRGDTLRVNGRASLLSDAPYADRMEVKGHRPVVILEIAAEEIYFHCAKAFLRSKLWEPETWAPDAVMSRAQIAKNLERPDESLEDIEAHYGQQYTEGLYRA
jgi:PPOX class probable FMN-dependent enzyme